MYFLFLEIAPQHFALKQTNKKRLSCTGIKCSHIIDFIMEARVVEGVDRHLNK